MCIVSMTYPQLKRGECTFRGQIVSLSRTEADVLATMLMRGPRPTTKHMLVEALYGHREDGGPDYAEGNVGQMIHRLRRKMPGLIIGRLTFGWWVHPGDDDEE